MGCRAQVDFWSVPQPLLDLTSSHSAFGNCVQGLPCHCLPPSRSPALWKKHTGGSCPLVAAGGQASPFGSQASEEPTAHSTFSSAGFTVTSLFYWLKLRLVLGTGSAILISEHL